MKKINVESLVSLIIEQINEQGNDPFPPDQFTFIDSLPKYMPDFQEGEASYSEPSNEPEGGIEPGVESEVDEMSRVRTYGEPEKLPELLRIPANMLIKGGKTPYIPNIATLDPETNEIVPGMVISDEFHTMPNGDRVLRFYNYGEEPKIDRLKKVERFVVLPENRYLSYLPRSTKMGTKYQRPDYEVAQPGETTRQTEIRLNRIKAIAEGNAKRYGIFPLINDVFSKHEILDRLDICLIPETWASTKRTEHTTNVVQLKKFGGTTPEIDADFYAARDLLNVNEAINSVMNLRADLAQGAMDDEQAFDINRTREISSHVPRRHANYIYTKGGNWEGKQRVHDPNFFKEAGGKTMVYQLNSKNIQEGLKELNVESVLHIGGNIEGNDYVLKATFKAILNARNLTSGAGENRGNLFTPITVSLIKPLPKGIEIENFSLDKNPEFFVNEGKTRSSKKTGFLPALVERLGNGILEIIDPDDVQQRIIQLAEEAVAENA